MFDNFHTWINPWTKCQPHSPYAECFVFCFFCFLFSFLLFLFLLFLFYSPPCHCSLSKHTASKSLLFRFILKYFSETSGSTCKFKRSRWRSKCAPSLGFTIRSWLYPQKMDKTPLSYKKVGVLGMTLNCWLVEFYGISTFVGYLMPNLSLYK